MDWTLELNMDREMIDTVLDQLAQLDPDFLSMATATRDPDSPAAQARRAANNQWEQATPSGRDHQLLGSGRVANASRSV